MRTLSFTLTLAALAGCAPGPDDDVHAASAVRPSGERAGAPVALGDEHTCAIQPGGRVECWGRNDRGQLGVAGGDRTLPTVVAASSGVDNVVALAAGANHTCALRADGTVRCWGDDAFGQLGNGSPPTEPIGGGFRAVAVAGLTRVTQIAAGGDTTCAVVASGMVFCWGRNDRGQLGRALPVGSGSHIPVPVSLLPVMGVNAVEVGVGRSFACARSSRGEVACWGDNTSGQILSGAVPAMTAEPRVPTTFVAAQLAVGDRHVCVRTDVGRLACWGAFGTPWPVPSGLAQVVAGRDYACAVQHDGEARCWGRPEAAALGMGFAWSASLARSVGSAVAAVYGGPANVCLESASGALQCFGANARGQVGDGTTSVAVTTATAVARAAPTDVDVVSVGWGHTCVRRRSGVASCWGDNGHRRVRDAATPYELAPVALPGSTTIGVVAGYYNTWATQATWWTTVRGDVSRGEGTLADNTTVRALGLDAGLTHACAVTGDGRVYCRGSDAFGQLGVDSVVTFVGPIQPAVGLTDAVEVATGLAHTCARRANGRVACWGFNSNGQLGDGTLTDRDVPTEVAGLTDAVAITAGALFTCALRADGRASCWGYNGDGQLGDGTYTDRATPAAVVSGLSDAVAIDAGGGHACAVRGDGTVACWGDNREGAVGTGTIVGTYATAQTVPTVLQAVAVSAGGATTCALMNLRRLLNPNDPSAGLSNFTLKCWGRNDRGQVGDGTTTQRRAPTVVPLT